MSRKKEKVIDFKFTPWPLDVTRSAAWAQLRNPARVAYFHIREKWWFNRRQPVSVSYKEMERIMGRKTFSSALKQLVSVGFLIKSQTGGLFRKRNYFDMSEEWRRADRIETKITSHTDGVYIKGSEMHTVNSGEKGSMGSQMHTVDSSGGIE